MGGDQAEKVSVDCLCVLFAPKQSMKPVVMGLFCTTLRRVERGRLELMWVDSFGGVLSFPEKIK